MNYVKYPRSFNLPFSQSDSSDDVWWTEKDIDRNFVGKEVVVSEKLDGEATSLYRDRNHARSIDSAHHPSRNWIKQFHATFSHEMADNIRFCGESVYAFHSIFYTDLPSYFFLYGVYDQESCLSWDETEEYASLFGLTTVPVLYRGIWDENLVKKLWTGKGTYPTYENSGDPVRREFPQDFTPCVAEGYVVRLASAFRYDNFRNSLAKFVRDRHVKSPQNWLQLNVVPNQLKLL